MREIVKVKLESCTGCNRCVRECPMEGANITYQDEEKNIKVKIDYDHCIACGRCFAVCKHDSRYFADDTERFFEDLEKGVPISLIAAPAIRTNIPEYKRLFTYLKNLGVNKIYDVSLGADICIWGYVRYLEKTENPRIITQPCPVIVKYCEIHKKNLLKHLAPVHSPMSCVSIYMKKRENITDKIAAVSPCVAKANEFEDTGLSDYNVTFSRLLEYIKVRGVALPEEETGFDHIESGVGSLFPMPGGLKENIEFFTGRKYSIDREEGSRVYGRLSAYAETNLDLLPQVFDVLNCSNGCNSGPACVASSNNFFGINRVMEKNRNAATANRDKAYFEAVFKQYDEIFDLKDVLREYKDIKVTVPEITQADINAAFASLGKDTFEKQNVDCGACGSDTCFSMARKIALGVNIPSNCIVKALESARAEHEENIATHNQLAIMEKIREADERTRIILDSNPHINILFDSEFKVVDCNPAAYEFMGFVSKEEMFVNFSKRLTAGIPDILSNGRSSLSMEEWFSNAAESGLVQFETEIVIDNKTHSLNVELKRIPYESSFAIVAYVFDMTEIHERENELIAARELNELQLKKLNLVVQATKIGLWDMEISEDDANNHISDKHCMVFSKEFRQMLGFICEGEFPNTVGAWLERLHPEDRERSLDAFRAHLYDKTGKTPYDIEYRLMKKDGEYAYFRASGETIRDEDGAPIRVAGSLADITETKNILMDTERHLTEAEAANKAKSAFLSTMSHEIRTPMNAILGITEIQIQTGTLEPSVEEAFNKIYASGDLLLGIINDILDLSKIEAGKLELIDAEYEIVSLISDTAQLNIMRIGSKPIEFEVYADEKTPFLLFGDELRIKQILNNLLSNAFKYTEKGTVKLSVSHEYCDEEHIMLVFSVSDTGQGMTKEQVEELFDEYTRFNMEANRTTEGTGLGMSITRNLVKMMNGNISIESEPGKGTTFTVGLLQGKAGTTVIGAEMAENLRLFRTKGRDITKKTQIEHEYMPYGSALIVDDVETNIYVAKGLMAPYGLKLDSVNSGFEAIDKVKDGNVYDIIFMDHMMPKMDGIETTKHIRDLNYSEPIVALTANAVAGQSDVFLANGFNDFISKPIDIRQLNMVLEKFIRDKQTPEVIEDARQKAKSREATRLKSAAPAADLKFAEIFLRDATKSLNIVEAIYKSAEYSEEDLRSYIINVHGMKSALANIGKTSLSAFAKELEKAGRDGNLEVIKNETPSFLDKLKALISELSEEIKAHSAETETAETSEEDKKLLNEKLQAVKTACEDYDENAADEILKELREKAWDKEISELLELISERLLHSDFDEATSAIEEYLK